MLTLMLQADETLTHLRRSYREALGQDVAPLRLLLAALESRQALFVASGGSLAVAGLAARLRMASSAELAQALSPLDLVGGPTLRRAGVVLISARASHPDIAFALEASRTRHHYPVGLVTHRPPASLDTKVSRHLSGVAHVPLATTDGFLSTHSVLTLATVFSRAFGWEDLPSELSLLSGAPPAALQTSNCLVLYGPGCASVAVDLETRLSELGLSAVQAVDYRNFGHGRHTGFARRQETTTVVALVAPNFAELARRTLQELPPEARLTEMSTPLSGPAGVIDLLAGSIRLVANTAQADGVNIQRPGVPKFGRKLYHLSGRAHIDAPTQGPVLRKLVALGAPASEPLRSMATQAFIEWRSAIQGVTFQAVALDYDGTVSATEHRYDLPNNDMRERLIDLLIAGCHIGFASGRGSSLYRDLRKWVPSALWSQIFLALHNGSWRVRLDQPPDAPKMPSCELSALLRRIEASPLHRHIRVRVRPTQINIAWSSDRSLTLTAVGRYLTELAAHPPELAVKIAYSGHSLDVLDRSTTKSVIIKLLEEVSEGEVLAIGDQGEIGGNDFEFLAATRWSLTVDRCSGDLSRCWNLASSGKMGPAALLGILRGLRQTKQGLRLRVQAS